MVLQNRKVFRVLDVCPKHEISEFIDFGKTINNEFPRDPRKKSTCHHLANLGISHQKRKVFFFFRRLKFMNEKKFPKFGNGLLKDVDPLHDCSIVL